MDWKTLAADRAMWRGLEAPWLEASLARSSGLCRRREGAVDVPSPGKRQCLGAVTEVFGVLQAVAAASAGSSLLLPSAALSSSGGFVSDLQKDVTLQVVESLHGVVSCMLANPVVERSVSISAAGGVLALGAPWRYRRKPSFSGEAFTAWLRFLVYIPPHQGARERER